jgi:glycosyltransferase involved in cell wall biosynthesis
LKTVVYDHRIFSSQQFGGISRYFCEVADRISQSEGWRARIIAPLHYNDYLARSAAPRLGMHLPARLGYRGRVHRAVNAVLGPALLTATGADIVHRTYYTARPRPARGRLVITVFDMIHELFPHYFRAQDPIRERKRRSVAAADHLLCISQRTADDLVQILDVPRGKITVTYLGFSDSFSGALEHSVADLRSERPYFLYVGERAGYKNFGRLVEAYGASPRLKRDFDLVAFGGSPFSAAELERIGALKLRPDSIRRQVGPDAELARAYAGAVAFVYPSEYEGFGIPPLEAMSRGCPVACSNTSSIPEVVGDAGEYFDPACTDSIRAALERLADDEARRRALIDAGRVQCGVFSWDRCATATLSAYRLILGE